VILKAGPSGRFSPKLEREKSIKRFVLSGHMHLLEILQQSRDKIKQNKVILLLLTILQIGVLIALVYLLLMYPAKILDNVQGILAPLEQANYNATLIQEGVPFSTTTELASVSQSYAALYQNMSHLFLDLLGIFLIIQAGIWILTTRLTQESPARGVKIIYTYCSEWSKYLFFAILFTGIPLIISYLLLKGWFNVDDLTISTWIMIIIGLCWTFCYYFQLVGFALINHPWKEMLILWKRISFKGILQNILILILMGLVQAILLGGVALFLPSQKWFILSFIFLIVWIISLVIIRIYWVANVKEQVKK